MNDYAGNPSSIEHDLAETRARLGNHLDELTRRLSPGQLVDEGLSYLRTGQGAVFARNLGAQLRDNPLPVALTGIGLAWLAVASSLPANGRGRSMVPYDADYARRSTMDSLRSARDSMYEQARSAGEAVTRTAEETDDAFRSRVAEARARILGIQQNVAETASAFADRVQQAFDSAQQTAQDQMERMRNSAGEWRDSIMEQGQRTGEAVAGAAQRGRDYAVRAGGGIADTVSDNPLLLGALGVTAGVLLGALLPRTEQEQALIGPATDWAAGAAGDAAGEAMERGTKAAKAAASAAWEAAREDPETARAR